MTKLVCNYCENEYEIVPLNSSAEEEKVCFCPYCGTEIGDDDELDFEDSEYEFED